MSKNLTWVDDSPDQNVNANFVQIKVKSSGIVDAKATRESCVQCTIKKAKLNLFQKGGQIFQFQSRKFKLMGVCRKSYLGLFKIIKNMYFTSQLEEKS